jgi:hypothetical protein
LLDANLLAFDFKRVRLNVLPKLIDLKRVLLSLGPRLRRRQARRPEDWPLLHDRIIVPRVRH